MAALSPKQRDAHLKAHSYGGRPLPVLLQHNLQLYELLVSADTTSGTPELLWRVRGGWRGGHDSFQPAGAPAVVQCVWHDSRRVLRVVLVPGEWELALGTDHAAEPNFCGERDQDRRLVDALRVHLHLPSTEKPGKVSYTLLSHSLNVLILCSEEELYFLLIDIMRSPETLKSITGSSLKKKLD